MDSTILLLIILLVINIAQFVTIYRLTQHDNTSTDFSEIYQKQIKNYNNIIRLTEKLTKELMNKAKEGQNNEKTENTTSVVQPEEQRRVY